MKYVAQTLYTLPGIKGELLAETSGTTKDEALDRLFNYMPNEASVSADYRLWRWSTDRMAYVEVRR